MLFIVSCWTITFLTRTDVVFTQHPSLKSSDTENFSVNVDVDDEDELSTDDDDDVSVLGRDTFHWGMYT